MEKKIEKKIYEITGLVLGLSPSALNLSSSTESVEGWDSAKHIDLILALEEEFNIEFDEEKVLEMLDLKLIFEAVKELKL